MTAQQLVFVYNADSGLFNSISDFAHKIISPATYNCALCALTYGNFTMKQEWKNFIETLPLKAVFLHRDEFKKRYGDANLPAIFIDNGNKLMELVSKQEIEKAIDLQSLKKIVGQKLNYHVQHHHSNL